MDSRAECSGISFELPRFYLYPLRIFFSARRCVFGFLGVQFSFVSFFSAMVTQMDDIYDLVFPLSYYWQLFNLCSVYGTRQCY